MLYRFSLRSIVALPVHLLGITRLLINIYGKKKYAILTYHRVLPRGKVNSSTQRGMFVTPQTFNKHLKFLKKHFSVLFLSEVYHKIQSGNLLHVLGKKPICVITFDDGWYDFYKYAFPILKKHKVPATVFLPTDFIGTKMWFWTDRLSHILCLKEAYKQVSEANISDPMLQKILTADVSLQEKIEYTISSLKGYPLKKIENVIEDLSRGLCVENSMAERMFLTWEEVRELKESGLVEFGSHTARHNILTSLSEEHIERELHNSKKKLLKEEVASKQMLMFCYPNGNYNEKVSEMVKKAGFKLAVTTRPGWNPTTQNCFQLYRISIHEDVTASSAMLGLKISGLDLAFRGKNRLGYSGVL